MKEEMLSCVDDSGLEIGQCNRRQCHVDPSLLHRVIHVMVENGQGRILLQKRSKNKDVQPGKWDMAVGGHVSPGEDAVDAAYRECAEELGVSVYGLAKLYTYNWITDIESEYVTTFSTCSEGPFDPDPDEIDDVRFFDWLEIGDLIASRMVTPNFIYEWSLYRNWREGRDIRGSHYPIYSLCRCSRCDRLKTYRESICGRGPQRHIDYWNKPVPGFGDLNASILVVGLAPGAHGANRTGRPFTGDAAGDILFKTLFDCGLSSMPSGAARGDGLNLSGVFITNAVKCVPPDNLPKPDEIAQCMDWFHIERDVLREIRKIICLGKLAFDTVKKSMIIQTDDRKLFKNIQFKNGMSYSPGNGLPDIGALYHPSRRNLNTGLISYESFFQNFKHLCEEA